MLKCPDCLHLKTLLRRTNLEYNEIVIGSDIEMNTFRTSFPHVDKTPFAIIDGVHHTSLVSVAKKLLEAGLIAPPQK